MIKFNSPTEINKENAGEPYIHRNWKHFKQNSNVKTSDITNIYTEQARLAKDRFKTSLGGVEDSEMANIINSVVGLYSMWNSSSTEATAQQVLMADIKKTVEDMNDSNLYTTLHHKNIENVLSDVDKLNEACEKQKEVIDGIEGFDKRIAEYYTDTIGKSVSSFNTKQTISVEGFSSLTNTAKVGKSIQNWKSNWELAEKALTKAKSRGSVQKTITVKDETKVKNKSSKKVSKLVGDTIGHMNNVKGEILEVGLTALLRGSLDELMKDFGATNGTITPLGEGKVTDPTSGKKVTRKTDVGLSFELGKNNLKVDIGFSAKAQFTQESSKKRTSFLRSNYETVMKKANTLGTDIEYQLNNLIAHGKYRESIQLRKLVAAYASLQSIGGIRGSDEVYFIVYLDKIITLPDLLTSMGSNFNSMLSLDINKKNLKVEKRMTTAWIRSHNTTESIRRLVTSVTG